MLTLHTADALLPGAGQPVVPQGAVVVDGSLVVAVGRYAELAAAEPRARVRRWPGLLTPGLVHPGAGPLLEAAYHPDPRETAELGEDPLTGPALAALEMNAGRWGASARRGLQRMLRHGTTAVVGPFTRPAVRTAVTRSGLVRQDSPGGGSASVTESGDTSALDPLAGAPLEWVLAGRLAPGLRADLAAFDGPERRRRCVATVLGGRLVYRVR